MTRKTTPYGASDGRTGPRRTTVPGSGADELLRWAASLPWVVQLPRRDRSELLRFAVDCPILACSGVWLLADTSEDLGMPLSIIVVLPGAIARRGVASGWAVPVTDLGEDQGVVAVASPRGPTEASALQALLMLSYTWLFRQAGAV
jgi:GAF domain-containing protein